MNYINVTLPLVDIIRLIITLYDANLKQDCVDISRDIVQHYKGNLEQLQNDIIDIFVESDKKGSFQQVFEKEYNILKEIFGISLVGYDENN